MARAEANTHCAVHPGEPAIARCDHCGKSICRDCRIEDVVADEEFCSESCRDTRSVARGASTLTSARKMLEGAKHPIRTGWWLWARSLGTVCLYSAPIAVALELLLWTRESVPQALAGFWEPVSILVAFFGIALTQVILSRRYTGLVQGNVYLWTLQRFVPWAVATVFVYAATFAGLLALVLPGIYLSVRLFWADELALVHRAGPIEALKQSWNLTRGKAGSVFKFQIVAGLASYLVMFAGAMLFLGYFAIKERLGGVETLGFIHTAVLVEGLAVIYGALHAPEIVYFYGMRAKQASPSISP